MFFFSIFLPHTVVITSAHYLISLRLLHFINVCLTALFVSLQIQSIKWGTNPSISLLDQSFSETTNAKRSRHNVKHGSNSTHPVIFGIRTVECIVAVIRGSWSDLVLPSMWFNSSLYKDSSMLLFGLRKQARGGGREGGRGVALIPGYCRACGESSRRDGDKRKKVSEQSFLRPRKEGRVSASVWLSDLQECCICDRASLLFFWQSVCDQLSPFPSFFSLRSFVAFQPT